MTMLAPGVAPANALQRHPSAFKWSMFFYRLHSISRTRGCKSTVCTEHRRNGVLINSYQRQKNPSENRFNEAHLLRTLIYQK